jgi:transposase
MDLRQRLRHASRGELIRIIEQQQAIIAEQRAVIAQVQATVVRLERRIQDLEGRPVGAAPSGVPGTKAESAAPDRPRKPRKPRARGYARRRSAPDERVEHRLERCPDCGDALAGGWVKRRREVVEVALAPARVVEHVFIERECARCGRRCVPGPGVAGVAGRQRFGVGLLALIATLREVGRWPDRTIRWYLEAVHRLKVSLGAIVDAQHQLAEAGAPELAAILGRIRASPMAHVDETGWREAGANGYAWTLSTPSERFFAHGRRDGATFDALLGPDYEGVIVSDFYAAYDRYEGLHQRCWVHLLRDIRDLRRRHPQDAGLAAWAAGVRALYDEAKGRTSADPAVRRRWKAAFEARLHALCAPVGAGAAAEAEEADGAAGAAAEPGEAPPHATLARRCLRYLEELFVFVADPAVPPDNNAAERSLRHLVTARKISGGTQSPRGTQTRMALASLFGTWRLGDRDLLAECRRTLLPSQV